MTANIAMFGNYNYCKSFVQSFEKKKKGAWSLLNLNILWKFFESVLLHYILLNMFSNHYNYNSILKK